MSPGGRASRCVAAHPWSPLRSGWCWSSEGGDQHQRHTGAAAPSPREDERVPAPASHLLAVRELSWLPGFGAAGDAAALTVTSCPVAGRYRTPRFADSSAAPVPATCPDATPVPRSTARHSDRRGAGATDGGLSLGRSCLRNHPSPHTSVRHRRRCAAGIRPLVRSCGAAEIRLGRHSIRDRWMVGSSGRTAR